MMVRMIEGLHLTATNKRHIAEMVAQGMTQGGTKTLRYEITDREGDRLRLTIAKRETDTLGRPIWRRGAYLVEVQA